MHIEKNDAARAVGRDPSLLGRHWGWILSVTLAAVAAAGLLAWALHDPAYRSEVRILVNPALSPSGAFVPPEMETERQVVVSGVVTSAAAEETGTSPTSLQRRASVSVPAASTVLVLTFEDETAAVAQRRAQAISDAYVDYRNGQAEALSAASLPRAISGPAYPVDLAAGLVVGLILGVGSALLRDRSDDRLRGPRDFVEQSDLPILATLRVPRWSSSKRSGLVILHEPEARAAEAYRQVRGKVTRAARTRVGATTVTLVTSAAGDDGAALVAANTATALALAGSEVLLVEGDVRTPRMGQIFGIRGSGGLTTVLAQQAPLVQAVRATRVAGLRLVPAGGASRWTPGELFDERAIGRVLSEVPADVDHVVIHAPPVLRAAETLLLADHAHLQIVVVTTGRTTRQDVRAAVTELVDAPGHLLGGVVRQRSGVWRHRRRARPTPVPPVAGPPRPVLGDLPVGAPEDRADDGGIRPLSRDSAPPVPVPAPENGQPTPTKQGGDT